MQVIRKTLLDVIAWDNEARFDIPKWQRHYAWEDREVDQMWQDWRNDCARGLKHFCGVLLFRPLPDSPNTSWEIVDGQQRMTTFFLFFLALRDYCATHKIIFTELSNIFTLPGSDECRLRLQKGMNEDHEVLNALLAGTAAQLDSRIKEDSLLFRAYSLLTTRIADDVDRTEIPAFTLSVLQNLDVVVLTVDESDDVKRIFEALNSRGKLIDSEELIRNLITLVGGEDQDLNERGRDTWNYIAGLFDQDDLPAFLDAFGRRNGKQTVRGAAFDEIRFELEIAKKLGRVSEWLREFRRAANNYSDILEPSSSDDPTQRLLLEIRRLKVPKLNPFLLALLEAFRETPASEPLLHNITAAMVRLLVTYDRPSYRIEKFANLACFTFYDPSLSRAAQLEQLIGLIDGIWVADDEFFKAFTTRDVYGPGSHRARLRYYLEKFEQKIGETSDMPFEIHFSSETTIEHIMPQKLDRDGCWERALRAKDVRLDLQHAAHVDTIGNLTVLLVDKNPAAGNSPYAAKRDFYIHPNQTLKKLGVRRKVRIGNCALNKYFESVPVWNFNTIAERSKYLAGLALQIWNKQDWKRETV
jgi:hypothetical protein